MSRSLRVAALILLMGRGAGAIDAQNPYLPEDERARLQVELTDLERSIQAITRVWTSTEDAERRAAERRAALRVTRTIGPIQLRSAPELADDAATAVRSTLDAFGRLLDGFSVQPTLRLDLYIERPPEYTRIPTAVGSGWIPVRVLEDITAWDIRHQVQPWVVAAIPGAIGAWSGGRGWELPPERGLGLRVMVRSIDPDGIACLQTGDLLACSRYFSLDYDGTLESRRAALDRIYPADPRFPGGVDPDGPKRGASLFGCAEAKAQQGAGDPRGECLASISEREAVAMEMLPGGAAARSSLLSHAVRLAPAGGFRRLQDLPAGATVGEQLEALSQSPLELLLTSWRQDASLGRGLFAADPRDRPGPTSLLWAGGLAMLALRSTRWRLG